MTLMFDGYKLSDRAARAALGVQEPVKPPMNISPAAVARARAGNRDNPPSPLAMDATQIYAPYKPMDGVLPDGLAMDSCMAPYAAGVTSWAIASLYHEGQGFFGYQLLAELMQRAEYRHACEIWAEHSVRKWIKLIGGTEEQRKQIEKECERLALREAFERWFFQDQAYGRGQMFLDFDDADKEAETRLPLRLNADKIGPKRPLQRITIVEPLWCSPGTYATNNPLRGDFYKPEEWFVFGRRVHASRLLTITSRPVSDMLKPAYNFGGQSLIQIMKPYVDNWLRTRQSTSDLVNAFSILVLKTDMSSIMAGDCGDNLFSRLDLFNATRDNRGSMAIDKDTEELESLAVPLGTLDKLQQQAQEQLASSARIPLSIYLQISPTGLNSSGASDMEARNFYADVHGYQEKNARQPLKTILQIIQLGLWGKIDPEIKFEFCPLWEMSDRDKADVRKSNADADCAYVQNGVIDPEEVRERLSSDDTSLYHGVDLSDPAPGYGNEGINEKPELDSPKI